MNHRNPLSIAGNLIQPPLDRGLVLLSARELDKMRRIGRLAANLLYHLEPMFDVAHLNSGQKILSTGAEINRLIDEGKLNIHIEMVLPIAEVKKAHQLSQGGHTRGKIVLQISP